MRTLPFPSEGAIRKALQYHKCEIIFHLLALLLKGKDELLPFGFNVQVVLALTNFLISVMCVYVWNKNVDRAEKAENTKLTNVLRVEYAICLLFGLYYGICPHVYHKDYLSGMGDSLGAISYWMSQSGAMIAGIGAVYIAVAQCDEACERKILQYGMIRHIVSTF